MKNKKQKPSERIQEIQRELTARDMNNMPQSKTDAIIKYLDEIYENIHL